MLFNLKNIFINKFSVLITLLLLLVVSTITLFCVSPVSAQISDIGAQFNAASQGAGMDVSKPPADPRQIAANIVRVVLEFLGMIFFVLTIYAGFLWMTAGGNDEQVGKAKTLLFQAVIGLFIILSAYSITELAIRFARGDYTDIWDGSTQRNTIETAPACTGRECPDSSVVLPL